MAMEVRKASRKKAKMRLGISAPAGAGKTMGSLIVAHGLCGDWGKIGLIDTENGSGELYEGQTVPGTTMVIGEYMYVRLAPPFTVISYMEAQKALEDFGCEVIILDSISHAWAGSGGLLDQQGHAAKKSGNSYTAWRDVTPQHNAFVEMMLQSPAHIIATMRAKVEYILETNDKGKQVPRKVGMAPVQREGLDFEFTVVMDIDTDHMASASKDRTSLFDGHYVKLSPDVGKKMLAWLNSGADAPPPRRPEPERAQPTDDELLARIRAALVKAETLETWTQITSHPQAKRLKEQLAAEIQTAYDRINTEAAHEPVENYAWPGAEPETQEAA